jgi:CRP-like cAMP-binding protein
MASVDDLAPVPLFSALDVLAEGTATVTSEGQAVAMLGPGDFFGEIAILGDGRRSATVTSTSPVHMLVMFGNEFRRLEGAHPEIASRVKEAIQARVESVPLVAEES